MTLPPVGYVRPRTLAEALTALAGDGARPLAGGQTLVPALAARLVPAPRTLVDLAAVPGLDVLEGTPDGGLRIGAMVRQRTAERSELVTGRAPMLAEALAEVGHPSVRHRGTVVGSVAHADPAAELPAVAVALGAVAEVAGPDGRRDAAVSALLAGGLRAGEVIVALRLPAPVPGEGQAWLETAPRRFDLPVAGAGARCVPGDGGPVVAGLVLGGAGRVPVDVGEAVRGLRPGTAELASALDAAAAGLDPPSDARGSAELRRHLARTLGARAIARAAERTAA
jgi:carbon-monoxide dehydrogenase medium subunit